MKIFNKFFNRSKNQNGAEGLLKYFKIEAAGEDVEIIADVEDSEILDYYSRVARFVQKCFRHHKIEHFLTTFISIAGQQIEVSLIKDGEKGPTRLLQDAKLENAKLMVEIERLKADIAKSEDCRCIDRECRKESVDA
jgi:hypothetical protein